VVGRDSAVIHLGVTACPSDAAGAGNGDTTVRIDRQTVFVLQKVVRQTNSGSMALTRDVARIRYNLPLPACLLSYAAPPGVQVIGKGLLGMDVADA
jgi:hypothetical protein